MLFATIGQGSVFLWMAAAGAVIALWYGLCAGLRRLLAAGFWLSLAVDAAFGAGAAVLFAAALFAANYGVPRLYDLLAAALGFALCAGALFWPARRAGSAACRACCRFFVKIGDFRWIKAIFR